MHSDDIRLVEPRVNWGEKLYRLARLLPDGRLHGNYLETAFEEVIEANRRGAWTINVVTVHVDFKFRLPDISSKWNSVGQRLRSRKVTTAT